MTAKWHNERTELELAGKVYSFASKLEARYAERLQELKDVGLVKSWTYLPEAIEFPKYSHGTNTYRPDFMAVEEDVTFFAECKGYIQQKDITKAKRFVEVMPTVPLIYVMARIPKHGEQRELYEELQQYVRRIIILKKDGSIEVAYEGMLIR